MSMPDRRTTAGVCALVALLVAAGVALLVVAMRGPAATATMEDRVRAVAQTLRCPVCQDLSAADSPSRLAEQFRRDIGQQLRRGESPQQIRQGFVRAYGQWILLSPPRSGINLVAWAAPFVLLAAGLVLAWWAVRRWTRGRSGSGATNLAAADPGQLPGPREDPLSADDRRLLDRALQRAGDEPA